MKKANRNNNFGTYWRLFDMTPYYSDLLGCVLYKNEHMATSLNSHRLVVPPQIVLKMYVLYSLKEELLLF